MKRSRFKFLALAVQVIVLGACAPQATPPPTPSPAPTLVSIDLAGPKMEVGSTILYADGTVLVAVPGGIFTMGGGGPDNFVHPVNVSDFWIYSTKVTNQQYAYCVALGLCTPPLKADNPAYADLYHANEPMVGVTFDQATAYCDFVHARLPTEAEWEKTARGPDGNIYPWGDGAPTCDLLNYGICVGKTTPVTTYTAGQSYYHAFDMEGNALEWVADRYQADYFPSAPTDDPTGPEKGRDRVVRSSAFDSGGDQTPAFIRFHSSPDTHRVNLGFRCVVDDPTYFAPFCNYPATYGTDGIGGGATGAQPQVDCPNVSIDQTPICDDLNHSVTDVTYVGSWILQLPDQFSCTSTGSSEYRCTGSGDLLGCYECTVTLGSPPLCPSGYSYDQAAHDCLPTAAGAGECLPGFTQSDAESGGQCCAYTPPDICGPGHDPQDPLCQPALSSCPAGTTFDGQECISTQFQAFCTSEPIDLAVCNPGGGGGDPLVCPGVSCNSGYTLNPNTCQCDCTSC